MTLDVPKLPGCGGTGPLAICPRQGIAIVADTERWKPYRSPAPLKVVFRGPSEMDAASVKLEVVAPSEVGTYIPVIAGFKRFKDPVTQEETPDKYEFEWQGPWTFPMLTGTVIEQAPLPFGNYTIKVRGKKTAASPELVSAPYTKMSLVRVSEILVLPDEWISQNPAVDLHPDEPIPTATSTGLRRPRPASGKRIYAEADWDAATSAIGPVHDTVRLQITTEPKIDTEDVPVYLRIMDVDDPDGDPIDKDGDGTATVNDNYGVGRIPETAMVFRETTTVQTTAQVSHAPGDNYRVAASTHRERLAELKPSPNSQTGEVFDLQLNPVEEQVEMSEMITVWRRLNLEIDSMAAPPTDPNDPERNFVEGTVTEIVSDNAGGVARVFIRADPAVPGMSNLTDGSPDRSWEPPDFGEGRFENGRVFWGGDVNENFAERVAANGTDYIEGPLRLVFTAQPVSGGVISAGRVVSGRPSDGLFRVRPGTAGFPAGNTEPVRFQIGATSWTVPAGGIGPGTPVGGPSGSELEYSVTVAEIGRPLRFRLLDDDQAEAPFEIDLSLLQASDSAETNALAGTYVRPRMLAASATNNRKPAFLRNISCAAGKQCSVLTGVGDTTRDVPQSGPAVWFSHLIGAFQGDTVHDGDPGQDTDPVILGLAVEKVGGIFVETLREADARCRSTTPVHELGHLLGLSDPQKASPKTDPQGAAPISEVDIMTPCGHLHPRYFSGNHIKQIRSGGPRQ